jgi:hypothetical protein
MSIIMVMNSTVTKHKETPGEKILVVPSEGRCRNELGTNVLIGADLLYVCATESCGLGHARVFERNYG